MSEVNFDCFDDANKDEIERLHHKIDEMESENSCNRLLITKLEDELVTIRKCESRNVSYLIFNYNKFADGFIILCFHFIYLYIHTEARQKPEN